MRFDRARALTLAHLGLLALACFVVFANSYHHAYHLDDNHLLVDNSYVRSLRFVPLYFTDARTMTSLPSNVDYRPVLQTTYALNYAISGYDTWSWHLVQILLHCVCVFGLYFLSRRLIDMFERRAAGGLMIHAPLLIALTLAVHPRTSGVINYFSARSSLLVAALLVPSFVLYLRGSDHPHRRRDITISCILFGLALLTKAEAIAALAVYAFSDVLLAARERMLANRGGGLFADLRASCTIRTGLRLAAFVAIAAVYLAVRLVVLRDYPQAARHAADMTPMVYLWTQITTGWYYVFTWIAPVRMVADDLTYPIFSSPFAPAVWLAIAGWLVAFGVALRVYATRPYVLFALVSALALLSPTSSIAPLAEMVNEHRPYLPIAVMSLAWLIPAAAAGARALDTAGGAAATIVVGGLAVWYVSLASLTWQRNRVFLTSESYYEDIISKAPSSRACNNYGLTFLGKGEYDEALDYFKRAEQLAPNWHIAHTNLGITYHNLGNDSLAQYHFDRAVQAEQYSAVARGYRADYFLDRKRYAQALDDLEKSVPLTREFYRVYRGMATAHAGLGDWRAALDFTKRCRQIDSAAAELDIAGISKPFWDSPATSPNGVAFYEALDTLMPGRWWIQQNIGDLAWQAGNAELSARAFQRSKQLKDSLAPSATAVKP